MHKAILTGLMLVLAFVLPAQSKKQIKELTIKSVTETVTKYRDGKETATYKATYKTFDKDGNTTLDIQYNENGTVRKKQTTKYDGKDKIEEVTENNGGDADDEDNDNNDAAKKYKKITWKYNSAGDKTEEVDYDA